MLQLVLHNSVSGSISETSAYGKFNMELINYGQRQLFSPLSLCLGNTVLNSKSVAYFSE